MRYEVNYTDEFGEWWDGLTTDQQEDIAARVARRGMTKRFAELREDLFTRSPESRDRVARKLERLEEELGLAELRARRDRTQAEIATAIGTSQPGVSRLERQDDVLVSTLDDYVRATGGYLRLIAEYPEYDIELSIPALAPRGAIHAFRIVWQNLQTRQLVHVGSLTYDGRHFVFEYTADARLHEDFRPFPACPDYDRTYRSSRLFSFIADRLPATADEHAGQLADWLGLRARDATPVELLARGAGSSSHDVLQIVPEPTVDEDGTSHQLFLASGIRHVDPDDPDRVAAIVSSLRPGTVLAIREQPDNEWDNRALLLMAAEEAVGWVPDYLVDTVHKARGGDVKVVVVRANGHDVPWHLRLLCELQIS